MVETSKYNELIDLEELLYSHFAREKQKSRKVKKEQFSHYNSEEEITIKTT